MANNHSQDEIHKKIVSLTVIIGKFFKTLFAVLLHPKATYDKLSNEGIRSSLMNPTAFLITNILIVHSIDYFFGYDIPEFPFEMTRIPNPLGNFPFIILRYLIGILLFLTIFKLFIRQYKLVYLFNKILPIVCYASAIYLPYAFLHGFIGQIIGMYLINSSYHILQNMIGPISWLFFSIKIFLFLLSPQIVFFAWWLWIVYLGVKSINLSSSIKVKRAIIISPIIFLLIQLSVTFFASYIMNSKTINAVEIIYTGCVYKILSQESPNYLYVMGISESISDNKQMPEYIRYAYKLIKMSSAIAIPTFQNDKAVTDEILKGIRNRDYRDVEKIFNAHINSLSANIDLKRELREVVEIRKSSTFVDLKGVTVTLHTKLVDKLENSFPDLIRVNKNNYIFVCPIVLSPALISIFP